MAALLTILHHYWKLLLIGSYPSGQLGGMTMTLLLSLASMVLTFPFSILLALAHARGGPWLRRCCAAWVAVIRGIPLIMLIFWIYFLVPLLIGRNVSGLMTMLVSLIIYETAYVSEIIRSGIEALPKGQYEAAKALGLDFAQCHLRIILPQAIFNTLPSLINQFTSIVKETSLGYVINVQEFTFAANQVDGELLVFPFQIFLILAAGYFVVCYSLTRLAGWMEITVQRRRTGQRPLAAPTSPRASLVGAPRTSEHEKCKA